MNKIKKNIGMFMVLLFVLLVFFDGCVSFRPIEIGLVEPKPLVRRFDPEVNRTLRVYISPDVKEKITIDKGEKYAQVILLEFRNSVKEGLLNTFEKNFKTVEFIEQREKEGLLLVIDYINPKWTKVRDVYIDGGRIFEMTFDMEYSATLYDGNFEVETATRRVNGENSCWESDMVQQLFEESLEEMYRDMNEALFTTRVLRMIQG